MVSRREEKAAFEKLKKLFPGEDVSLECKYSSWTPHPFYYAYASGLHENPGTSTTCTSHLTPEDAVNDLISLRKEVTKDQESSG